MSKASTVAVNLANKTADKTNCTNKTANKIKCARTEQRTKQGTVEVRTKQSANKTKVEKRTSNNKRAWKWPLEIANKTTVEQNSEQRTLFFEHRTPLECSPEEKLYFSLVFSPSTHALSSPHYPLSSSVLPLPPPLPWTTRETYTHGTLETD